MGQVERGVVRGSNQEGPGGDRRNNGFMPLSGGAATVHPSNMPGAAGDRRGGSFPLSGGASTVKPPNADQFRFNVDQVKMPQPESAVEPGVAPYRSTRSCRAARPSGRCRSRRCGKANDRDKNRRLSAVHV